MLTAQEYKILSKLQPLKAWRDLIFDWTIIFLAVISVHFWPYPFTYMVAIILIARTQLALSILMHEAAHRSLFKNGRWNDLFCQWLVAAPVLFSMYSYKRNHLIHHQVPLQKTDPDITLTGGYPVPLKSFLRKLARDVSGISYFKFIKYFLYASHSRSRDVRKQSLPSESALRVGQSGDHLSVGVIVSSIVVAYGTLITLFWLSGRPYDFFLLWLLPMMTILQVLLRIRGIAEHAGYQADKNQLIISRTIVNPWQTFFLAPHNVNFHVEHHAYPKIPYYNLSKVHKIFRQRGTLLDANFFRSYRPILQSLILPP